MDGLFYLDINFIILNHHINYPYRTDQIQVLLAISNLVSYIRTLVLSFEKHSYFRSFLHPHLRYRNCTGTPRPYSKRQNLRFST